MLLCTYRCIQITLYRSSLTAHSCSRNGPATAWLTSERSAKLYLFQKYLLCLEHEYIVSRNNITSVIVTFCVFYNLFIYLIQNFWHSTSLHCLKETAQSCEFNDNVFETDRKRLELRALCFPPDQLASSPPRCHGSSFLTRTIRCLSCLACFRVSTCCVCRLGDVCVDCDANCQVTNILEILSIQGVSENLSN